mgnify:FL=1
MLTIILITVAIYYLIGIYLAIGWSKTWHNLRYIWIVIAFIAWSWPILVRKDAFDD